MLYEAAPYCISLAILIAAIVLFFALARGRYVRLAVAQTPLRVLAALPLLLSAVLLHFLRINEATAMLPPIFPGKGLPRFLIVVTGILEVLGAVGLFVPRTRRAAAFFIAIMMVLVFPVNVFVAGESFGGLLMPSVPVRLAMQVIYIWVVLLAGYGLPARP